MKKNADLKEYRGFVGLDTRANQTLVRHPHLLTAKNTILHKGVIKSQPGVEVWGTLDHSSLSGTVYTLKGFDVGATEYLLLHKGASLYYGTKNGSWTQINDLDGVAVSVSAAESEMEALGSSVGSTGSISHKVLFKQDDGCKTLEFIDASSSWIGRDTGIDASGVSFVLSDGIGAVSPAGTYRVRVTAQRIIDDIRVNESAPVGNVTGEVDDPPLYQEIEILGGGGTIDINISDSSPDSQTTHYGVQITRVLDMVGDTEYSQNGNDPTTYYEAASIPSAQLDTEVNLETGVSDLEVVVPDLTGYRSIPGHLISKVTGDILFFCGIAGFINRIYYAGDSGFYYHSELYNPYEFVKGGEDDGQDIIGLGEVQDHLLVLKEARTGILPNRDVSGKIVWRDQKLGIKNRNDFDNVSEDEVIVFNQDKIIRVFDGIRYSQERTLSNNTYGFSENIRAKSEAIDSDTIDFIFHDERMHIFYDNSGAQDALVLHPRDYYGWTVWEDTNITRPLLVNNRSEFIFEYDSKLWKVTDDTMVDVNGLQIHGQVDFALMTSQLTQRNIILVKEVAVDGSFSNNMKSLYTLNLGATVGELTESVPEVNDGYDIPWYQLPATFQLSGQYIMLTLYFWGETTIRGLNWIFIEKRTGSPWQLATHTPNDFVLPRSGDIDEVGDATDEVDEDGTRTTDISETG